MAIIYARLDIGNSRTRLAFLRNRAASNGKTWREVRTHTFKGENTLSPGFNTINSGSAYEKRTPVMYSFSEPQFRNEIFADEHQDVRMDHSGWYSDMDCSYTYRAFVFNLPHGRFGTGYYMNDGGQRVYLLQVFDNVRDAASAGDSEAEYYAEEERAYSIRWNEAHALADHIRDKSRDVARMFKLRNTDGFDIAADYRELEESISSLRNMKARMISNYSDVEI